MPIHFPISLKRPPRRSRRILRRAGCFGVGYRCCIRSAAQFALDSQRAKHVSRDRLSRIRSIRVNIRVRARSCCNAKRPSSVAAASVLRTRRREGGRKGRKGRVRGKEGERERRRSSVYVCMRERGREGEEERAGNETGGGNRSPHSALTRPRVSHDYVAT